jgi:uncharacterized protein YqhQ
MLDGERYATATRLKDGSIRLELDELPIQFGGFDIPILRGPIRMVGQLIDDYKMAIGLCGYMGGLSWSAWKGTAAIVGLSTLIWIVVAIGVLIGIVSGSWGKLFSYHGAEHQTIQCYEAKLDLTDENVRTFPTAHARCGTVFVVWVVLLDILWGFVAGTYMHHVTDGLGAVLKLWAETLFVLSFAYEIVIFLDHHENSTWARMLNVPGMWLQKITTKPSTPERREIAITALSVLLLSHDSDVEEGGWLR